MARSLRGAGHLPSQTPRTQEELAQAAAALGSEYPPDRGNRLRKAPRYFRSSRRAAPRTSRVAVASGGAGCAAQLLHLPQRPARSSPPGLCRLVGMVISKLTPSVEEREGRRGSRVRAVREAPY